MKCTAYSRAERSSPADGVSSCKQSPRLSLSSAAPLKKHDVGRVFFNVCKVFCTNLCDLFQKSHVEPVVCARRLRILRALIAFSCRLNYPAKLHAATACRFCVRPAHRCKNFAGGFVGCVRGFLLPAISASSLAVSSSMVYFVIEGCRRRYCLFWFFNFIISWIFF